MEKVRRQTPGSVLYVIPGADDALQAEYKFMRMGATQDLCDNKAAVEVGVSRVFVLVGLHVAISKRGVGV